MLAILEPALDHSFFYELEGPDSYAQSAMVSLLDLPQSLSYLRIDKHRAQRGNENS